MYILTVKSPNKMKCEAVDAWHEYMTPCNSIII